MYLIKLYEHDKLIAASSHHSINDAKAMARMHCDRKLGSKAEITTEMFACYQYKGTDKGYETFVYHGKVNT